MAENTPYLRLKSLLELIEGRKTNAAGGTSKLAQVATAQHIGTLDDVSYSQVTDTCYKEVLLTSYTLATSGDSEYVFRQR
jgi:hypothetical protein